MSFFEKIKKSVSSVSVDRVSQSENENSPANDQSKKAPLAAIVEATDDINPSDAQSRALEAVSDQEISKTIIEACRVEYEYRRAGRIVEADKINGLLDSIDSPELKTSDPAFIRSYLDLVRALKQ